MHCYIVLDTKGEPVKALRKCAVCRVAVTIEVCRERDANVENAMNADGCKRVKCLL